MSIAERLPHDAKRFDVALAKSLAEHAADAPPKLVEALHYSLMGPGKRLRPLLCLWACHAAGGTESQALPAAIALEMVHTYSLIHDDLPAMDDDDLRRGRPTCHKQFDEATAILAGDALLTMAFEVIAAGCPAKTAAVSCLELARGAGAAGMVGGQILDLAANAELESIHNRKTGALFRASLRLGLFAAQAENTVNPITLATLDAYSAAFGLLFQVTDDLLDVQGTAETTGKHVGKDAAKGKLTYPSLLGIEESKARAKELAERAVKAAESLGTAGNPLAELAQYVYTRDR